LCHRVPKSALCLLSLIKVPVCFNLVLLIYPSYGPWKSLKSLEFDFDKWARTLVVAEPCPDSGMATDSVITCPWLFETRHFRRFGFADIPYVIRRTIGLLSDSYTS